MNRGKREADRGARLQGGLASYGSPATCPVAGGTWSLGIGGELPVGGGRRGYCRMATYEVASFTRRGVSGFGVRVWGDEGSSSERFHARAPPLHRLGRS